MKLNTLQLRRAASALLLGLLMGVAMPKMNAQTAHVGDILCEGDLIVSPANYNAATHTAKAVVFYVDNTGQHGWAIALQDAGSYGWRGGNFYPYENDTPLVNFENKRQCIYDLDGYSNTQLVRSLGNEYDYPAFYAVDFDNGWYLPAIGQLNYLYGNLEEMNASLEIVGGAPYIGGWEYWSSTESYSFLAWYLTSSGELGNAGSYSSVYHYYYNKTVVRRVRGVINF